MLRRLRYLAVLLAVAVLAPLQGRADYLDALKKEKEHLRIINTEIDAGPVFQEALASLAKYLSLRISSPPRFKLVTGAELDTLSQGIERRLHIGLYRWTGGHNVYVLTDLNRDKCFGVAVHELTHAWQMENTPRDQELVIREGFASWVAYKILQWEGAYVSADAIHNMADPVYGVGFKLMLDLEKAHGVAGLIEKMKTMRKATDK